MKIKLLGGVEAGGTKFACVIGSHPGAILARKVIPTTSPDETLAQVLDFFRAETLLHGPIEAVGIASFGPIDLKPGSATYGYITSTTKPGWSNTNIAGAIGDGLDAPVGYDTDVNGAALGEWRWGNAQGLDTFVYLTVGTGIGGGGLVDNKRMHGLVHPEMGHIRIPHNWQEDPFEGICPFHGDCLEGLASGPALEKRWSLPAEELPIDHPAWGLEAEYLALGLVNIISVISPQRILLGGGVMGQAQLFPMIRTRVIDLLNEYVQSAAITRNINEYIAPPALGSNAGVAGALALALEALNG